MAMGRTQGQAPEVDGVTYVKGRLDPSLVPGDVVKVTHLRSDGLRPGWRSLCVLICRTP